MYPDANLPSGNSGTINFTLTKSSNSTKTLGNIIRYGASPPSEFPDLPTILKATPQNPVAVNADPGISAGIKDDLEAIIGTPRILPLYSTSSGNNGNNLFVSLVRFVPVVILEERLTGGSKRVQIEPVFFSDYDTPIVPDANPDPRFARATALVR